MKASQISKGKKEEGISSRPKAIVKVPQCPPCGQNTEHTMTSKLSKIDQFFRKIDRREYIERIEIQLQDTREPQLTHPQIQSEEELGTMRIATINTCGTQSLTRMINQKKISLEKAPAIEGFVKSENIDALLVQELRSGTWKDKFKTKPRLFESKMTGQNREGGRAAIIIFNHTWEISPVVYAGRDVVAVWVVKPRTFLLVSVYLAPNNFPRAQKALSEIKRLKNHQQELKIIIGGDFNSTETSEGFDIQPPGQQIYDRLKEPIAQLREDLNLTDPVNT